MLLKLPLRRFRIGAEHRAACAATIPAATFHAFVLGHGPDRGQKSGGAFGKCGVVFLRENYVLGVRLVQDILGNELFALYQGTTLVVP